MAISQVTQTQHNVHSSEMLRPRADSTGGFESAMASINATHGAKPGANSGFDVTGEFKQQLRDLAKNEGEFYQLLDTVFGPGVDRGAASRLRSQVLNNDFSFLPEHQFVDGGLGDARGVFDERGDRIVLRSDLSPELASKVYTEEAMHSLENDLLGKHVEAAGDEGAIGRILLNGEELSPEQLAALRSEDDFRTVTLDGLKVRVEADGDDVGGGDNDDQSDSDMEAEDISANPGDQQDGIGQSPGEDTYGPGDDDSSFAQIANPVSRAQRARDATKNLAINAHYGNRNGWGGQVVQEIANKAGETAKASQDAANEAKDTYGADSPEAKEAQAAADVAKGDAEYAQDQADEAKEADETGGGNPGAPVAALSDDAKTNLVERATDAGIEPAEANRLVVAINDATTRGERGEAYGEYRDAIRATPVEKLSEDAVTRLTRRALADYVPQAKAEELSAAIGNAKTRGERSDAFDDYWRTIRAHRGSEETSDSEAE